MAQSKFQNDWVRCCLCQNEKNKDLKSPPTYYSHQHDGYTLIAIKVRLFHAINELPIALDPARLNEGGVVEKTLGMNKAQYHQSCCLLFNNNKLDRARTRRANADSTQPVEGRTKLKRTTLEGGESECFLCERQAPASEIRQVITIHLDKKLSECAQNLIDEDFWQNWMMETLLHRNSSTMLDVWQTCTTERWPTSEWSRNRKGMRHAQRGCPPTIIFRAGHLHRRDQI